MTSVVNFPPHEGATNASFFMMLSDAMNTSAAPDMPGFLGNETRRSYRPPGTPHIKYITLAFYLATFVFGLMGNTLVLYVIARFSKVRQRSVANYYIWNLALADELFIFTLPWFCAATYTSNWLFGDVMCKITYVIRECNKFASVFTLVALTVDRYMATYHNLGRFRTIRVGKAVCLAIWITCLVSCTPYMMYSYTVSSSGRTTCKINWPKASNLLIRRIWTYTQLVIGYLLPLCVIVTCNVLLLHRLKGMMRPGAGEKRSRNNSSMTKTVLTVVIIFMVFQAPYYVMEIISLRVMERFALYKQAPTRTETLVFVHFNMVAQILVFVSSSCNPIIYGVFNRNFSKYSDIHIRLLITIRVVICIPIR